MHGRFRDRSHAGQLLAKKIGASQFVPDKTVVLALPRGGVVVAYQVAQALGMPLDVCVVRKLGVPWQPELAMGAIASGGVVVLHDDLITTLGVTPSEVERVLARERQELERREHEYRGRRPASDLTGKTAIVVDDGIATGATVEAAVQALRQLGAARIVVAVGVSPPSTLRRLARLTDDAVAVLEVEEMGSIGEWFENFDQVSDSEVQRLLKSAQERHEQPAA